MEKSAPAVRRGRPASQVAGPAGCHRFAARGRMHLPDGRVRAYGPTEMTSATRWLVIFGVSNMVSDRFDCGLANAPGAVVN